MRRSKQTLIPALAILFGACGPNSYSASDGKDAAAPDATSTGGHDGSVGGGPDGPDGATPPPSNDASPPAGGDSGNGADVIAPPVAGGLHKGPFVHPGILVSDAQLAFVKMQIAAGAEPWTSALAAAKKSSFAATSPTGMPPAHICCGTVSKPDVGCNQEKTDAETAYTDALLWYLSPTGGDVYGKAAVGILNNYASVGPDHVDTKATCTDAKGNTGASFNTRLQSGWAGAVFPRAAEIMRGYTGSPPLDVAGFKAMLKKSYLPNLVAGAGDSPGNWELSIAEALLQIGVFLDDDDVFNQGLVMWRRRVPAYLYVKTDGPAGLLPAAVSGPLGPIGVAAQVCITPDWCPNTPDIWLGPKTYVDGVSQETCRDLSHVQYGVGAMINGAETARIQGVDLYAEEQTRIVFGLELTATYLSNVNYGGAAGPNPGCSITDPYQGGPLDMSPIGYLERGAPPAPTWEIALNHYGAATLPKTAALVSKVRPTGADHHMNWETLTHGDVAKSGGPVAPPPSVP